jgi:hypothetical protein
MKYLVIVAMLVLSGCATSKAVVTDVKDGFTFMARGVEYFVPVPVEKPVKDFVEVVTTPDKDQKCKHKRRKCK